MRILEILLTIITLLSLIFSVWGHWKKTTYYWLLSTVLVIGGLHVFIDKVRIQMLGTYLIAFLSMGYILYRLKHQNNHRQHAVLKGLFTFISILVIAISTFMSIILPVFTMPQPTGKYGIGEQSRILVDSSRSETFTKTSSDKRNVAVSVWYPTNKKAMTSKQKESYPSSLGEAMSLVFNLPKQLFSHLSLVKTHVVKNASISNDKKNYPVVLFSPGIRSTRYQSMSTVEELVSRGYIVVGMDHPYTSAKVKLSNGKTAYYQADPKYNTSKGLYNYNVKSVAVRAKDVTFVIDKLSAWNQSNSGFTGKLNMNKIGMFGHSFGGATTAEALAQDNRIKAGVSLEGGFWGTVATKGVSQPFMYIMSGNTAESLKPHSSVKEQVTYKEFKPDLNSVMKKSTNDTYFLTVDKFYHQSFTEISYISPLLFARGLTPYHTVDITRTYVSDFFDHYLKGDKEKLLTKKSDKYPEVIFNKQYTNLKK